MASRIASAYPNVRLEFLLTGEGDVFKPRGIKVNEDLGKRFKADTTLRETFKQKGN